MKFWWQKSKDNHQYLKVIEFDEAYNQMIESEKIKSIAYIDNLSDVWQKLGETTFKRIILKNILKDQFLSDLVKFSIIGTFGYFLYKELIESFYSRK
jgi:hypothetical protein